MQSLTLTLDELVRILRVLRHEQDRHARRITAKLTAYLGNCRVMPTLYALSAADDDLDEIEGANR